MPDVSKTSMIAVEITKKAASLMVAPWSFGSLLLKNNDVLPRQDIERLDPAQGVRLHFFDDLLLRHLVDQLDRNVGVFHAKLDKDHAAARLQGFDHRRGHLEGV